MSEEIEKSKEQPEQEPVKEPEQDPGKKAPEKTLTQTEVNRILADERRAQDKKYKDLQSEYNDYRKGIEDREKAANDAAAEKVEALRKDLPESITKLLDKLTPIEQLDWLNDPENAVIEKKQIPPVPSGIDGHGKQQKRIHVV